MIINMIYENQNLLLL